MALRGAKLVGLGREECIDGISLLRLLHIIPYCTVLSSNGGDTAGYGYRGRG
jgi:hypothetical protein